MNSTVLWTAAALAISHLKSRKAIETRIQTRQRTKNAGTISHLKSRKAIETASNSCLIRSGSPSTISHLKSRKAIETSAEGNRRDPFR